VGQSLSFRVWRLRDRRVEVCHELPEGGSFALPLKGMARTVERFSAVDALSITRCPPDPVVTVLSHRRHNAAPPRSP